MLEINQLESEITNLNSQYRSFNEKKHMLADRVNRYSANSSPKREQIVDLKQRKRRMEARIELLNAQLGTPLTSSLSTQERTMLDDLQV
jgi:chromosome segregation ATPase